MIPKFIYKSPNSVEELLVNLSRGSVKTCIVAGGTDVVPGFMQGSSRFSEVDQLLDIKNIAELKTIQIKDNALSIGAGVTFTQVMKDKYTLAYTPLLVKAAQTVGSLQIRNKATVVGNFVNNAPCADSVPPLLVYDASIKILSPGDSRIIPLSEFLIKPYKTQLQNNEFVSEIIIPLLDSNYYGDFYKLGRRKAVSISRITLAVLMRNENNIIKDFKVASGAITPIGKRFFELEDKVIGKPVSTDTFMEIAENMGEIVLDFTGLRWSTPYKLPVLQQMLYQLLEGIRKMEMEQ
jgi:carbon-monoxide dehydrogenase medium subunit/xanthine dehydrogenase FAD-binding subunit